MSYQLQMLSSLKEIWRRRRFVALVTILVFVATLIQAILSSPAQQSEVILLVSNVRATGELASRLPSGLNPKAYSDLINSLSIKGALYNKLAEEGFWNDTGGPPPLSTFLKGLSASTTVVDQTTRPVTYAPFITLRVRRKTAEVASAVAEAWASVAIEVAQRRVHVGNEATRSTLIKQKESLREELAKAWGTLAAEKAAWNLDSIRTDLNQVLGLQNKLENMQVDAENAAAGAEKRLAVTTELLKTEPVHLQLSRAPSDDVFWLVEQESDAEKLESLQKKVMVSEVLNPAYREIRSDDSSAQQALATAKAKLATLAKQSAALDQRRTKLQQELANHDLKQGEMILEVDNRKNIFSKISEFETFTNVAFELATAQGEDDDFVVGLNRLNSAVYTKEYALVGRSVRVLAVTALGAIAAMGYVFLRCFIPLQWNRWKHRLEGEREKASVGTATDSEA